MQNVDKEDEDGFGAAGMPSSVLDTWKNDSAAAVADDDEEDSVADGWGAPPAQHEGRGLNGSAASSDWGPSGSRAAPGRASAAVSTVSTVSRGWGSSHMGSGWGIGSDKASARGPPPTTSAAGARAPADRAHRDRRRRVLRRVVAPTRLAAEEGREPKLAPALARGFGRPA